MKLILLGSACNDYMLASVLYIIKRVFTLIQIVVPIILIVSCIMQFLKLVMNPDDDKKGMKKIINSFISAVIVFFLPTVINLTMNILYEYGEVGIDSKNGTTSLNISACWNESEKTKDTMDSARENNSKSSTISKDKQKQKKLLNSNLGSGNTSNSSSGESSSSGSSSNNYSSNSNTSKGVEVINYAKQFVGKPYVWGGTSLTNGVDCSGFTLKVYEHFGITLPHSSEAQRKVGKAVNGIKNARAGDIICYSGHVALFMGNGKKIIHASSPKTGIKISDNAEYRKIVAIRRVLND